MSAVPGRIAAGLVVLTLLAGGAALDRRHVVLAENEALRTQIAAVQVDASVARTQVAQLERIVAELHTEHDVLDELVALRTPFIESIGRFAQQLERAEGKVDAAPQREVVQAAQDDVLAERADPGAVAAATAEVDAAATALSAAVDEFDAEQERLAALAAVRSAGSGSFSGGGGGGGGGSAGGVSAVSGGPGASGYSTVRAALDAVGGGGVPLEENAGACGLACASSRGVITFRPALAGESWGKILWVMSHELAHIHQFRVWNALSGSSTYSALYGGDIEHLANCMATARGYASSSCSGEQLDFAAGIWSGRVG